jgi:hypothetical protein
MHCLKAEKKDEDYFEGEGWYATVPALVIVDYCPL